MDFELDQLWVSSRRYYAGFWANRDQGRPPVRANVRPSTVKGHRGLIEYVNALPSDRLVGVVDPVQRV